MLNQDQGNFHPPVSAMQALIRAGYSKFSQPASPRRDKSSDVVRCANRTKRRIAVPDLETQYHASLRRGNSIIGLG